MFNFLTFGWLYFMSEGICIVSKFLLFWGTSDKVTMPSLGIRRSSSIIVSVYNFSLKRYLSRRNCNELLYCCQCWRNLHVSARACVYYDICIYRRRICWYSQLVLTEISTIFLKNNVFIYYFQFFIFLSLKVQIELINWFFTYLFVSSLFFFVVQTSVQFVIYLLLWPFE